MISDERLEMISKYDTFVSLGEAESMAKELIALREAFSEPVAFIVHAHGGDQLTFDGDYAANCEGNGLCSVSNLYRKPTDSTT